MSDNKKEELEERKKEITKKRDKIQNEYNSICKRNEEIDSYIEKRTWDIRREMDNPMIASDPELQEMYQEKAARLKEFSDKESEFRYEIDKQYKKLNSKLDEEEQALEQEYEEEPEEEVKEDSEKEE